VNRFCLAALLLFGASSSIVAPPSWSLMPWPKKMESAGAPLRLDRDFRVPARHPLGVRHDGSRHRCLRRILS